jgi:tRNA-specific 2-thiouridylase
VLAAVSSFSSQTEPQAVLYTSEDEHKDQTYFLSQLSQAQLRQAVFPLGGMPKPEVRQMAERLLLPNRARKDSQGICFLGQLDYDQFLRGHLAESPGEVREFETGEVIGTHRGLWHHTVGQRRGVGPVLHPKQVSRGPWYVVSKDTTANQLLVSRAYLSTEKARNNFYTDRINWIAGAPPDGAAGARLALRVKVRHGAAWHAAAVTLMEGGRRAHVQLEERDKGLAPGQFAAFYDGAVCLGSGVISEEGLYW